MSHDDPRFRIETLSNGLYMIVSKYGEELAYGPYHNFETVYNACKAYNNGWVYNKQPVL